MVLGNLVIDHDLDSKIANDDLKQNEKTLDDVNCSFQWQQQSIIIQDKQQNERQLQDHRQKPEAC